ncbi:MAG TPA: hypothetical protein VIL64_01305 [Solirubrobacteraceae bacterium]|jgi:hypothetical protein
MSAEELLDHLERLATSTDEELDELLTDLLVRVYPTKRNQDS